ncbi:AmmeMemoRadiSam system radical SAM enzyme [Candidatus Peregrinibacteria bacterium]|nr:AmmeMemoRadiSam system radical SAM enzyme [Candidatus Peregrinibacteria bacterium]
MKKNAIFVERLEKPKNAVRCLACGWKCVILPGKSGQCGIRKNVNGKLSLTTYGKPIGCHLDPIEKKPFFHFLPGTAVYSFGTYGCNFGCLFCQNSDMSQTPRELFHDKYEDLLQEIPDFSPQKIVKFVKQNAFPSIAYTYNEPTIFAEYWYDITKLAKKAGIRNVLVSNGFFSDELFEKTHDVWSAINIDLKGFSDEFYRNVCKAHLSPLAKPDLSDLPKKYQKYEELGRILKNIKKTYDAGIWVEVTTLIIPGENDSDEMLRDAAEFVASVSPEIPWHISAFHPAWKMLDTPVTPRETLERAYLIGKNAGLHYVYTGNVTAGEENTFCPKCGKLCISRNGYQTPENNLQNGKCPKCQEKIAGVWGEEVGSRN